MLAAAEGGASTASRARGVAVRRRSWSFVAIAIVTFAYPVAVASPDAQLFRSSSSALAAMTVQFGFDVNGTDKADDYRYVGSGNITLADTPPANTYGHVSYGTSTVVIRRGGSSATFTVRAPGYGYTYRFEKSGSLTQMVTLVGDITRSTIKPCRVGTSGKLRLLCAPGHPGAIQLQGHACGVFPDGEGRVRIVPSPRPVLMPSTLTLTVNGLECKARVGVNCNRPGNGGFQVTAVADSSLSIQAETDHPMPAGWALRVNRTGDPLSKGNGDYYMVCETKTEDSCEATRPGRPKGTNGDDVYAAVFGPTGGPIVYAQIQVDWT